MPNLTIPCTQEDETGCQGTHDVSLKMIHPGSPGRLTGPWEDCYPPEPAEYEIECIEPCSTCGRELTPEEESDIDVGELVEREEEQHKYDFYPEGPEHDDYD